MPMKELMQALYEDGYLCTGQKIDSIILNKIKIAAKNGCLLWAKTKIVSTMIGNSFTLNPNC